MSNITIQIRYPTIVFEVPHRIQAYTTSTPISFGFTRSISCVPKLPLPSTLLVLSICSPEEVKTEDSADSEIKSDDYSDDVAAAISTTSSTNLGGKDCHRDFAPVFQDPLHSLQREGHVTMSVECHLWARNATYRVQMREKSTRTVIAKSRPIRVEWGSQFSINVSKPTVMPCRGSIRAIVSHPSSCILPGKDKIRVYGHETLSVPSALVPSRLSYIAEHKIQPNSRVVTFRCNLFPQRFLRFCFQYINTAVDDSVAIVVEKCIPTNPPLQLADGGWGAWSVWTPCTVSCGPDGRQYRYRFCDNPPPSAGANFCHGESIEERGCDSAIPTCPTPILYVDTESEGGVGLVSREDNADGGGSMSGENNHHYHHHSHSQHRHSLHQLQLENVTLTPGCECGCILYDLVPERNDTLVIFISSNYSSPCADEDEVDHHKFKWIFHAKDERDRVRLEVVEMEVQCVTITFRDGNTTDSNLLQVITSEEQHAHYEESSRSGQPSGQLWDNKGGGNSDEMEEDVFEPLTLESTGSSLSISAFDTNKNCSGQFIYFIAYYSTLTSANVSLALTDMNGGDPSRISYDFWTFLVLKLILLFFVLVIILSGFGGCVTKAYRKEKYKELKCFDNEDEAGTFSDGTSNPEGRRGGGDDDSSRCTSVTLMSFDYSYWRRIRLLRLKYFLLRPRPLNYVSSKVKSFPSTPTHSRRSRLLTKARAENKQDGPGGTGSGGQQESSNATNTAATSGVTTGEDKSKYRLSKSISLSETNLRVEKVEEQQRSAEGRPLLESRKKNKGKMWTKELEGKECAKEDGRGADGAKSRRMTRPIYSKDPLSIATTTSVSNSLNSSSELTMSTPTPTPIPSSKKRWSVSVRKGGNEEKLLKEEENLKRRAKEKDNGIELEEQQHQSRRKIHSNFANKNELDKVRRIVGGGVERVVLDLTGLHRKRDIGKSQLSLATTTGSLRRCGGSSCGEEDSSRTELDDADQDFEMDYYDYDVMNAGNIPGSYLGLEPAFVLWNSEVYHDDEQEDQVGGGEEEGIANQDEDEDDPLQEHHHLIIPMSSSNASSSHEECDIEMTATASSSNSTSVGIFSDPFYTSTTTLNKGSRRQITVKETSLDTLKFADEDDDSDIEEDDNATQGSDSIFNTEQDLINDDDDHHQHNQPYNLASCR
ncbi:Semaphorin-5B [Folsomia candida]|uniref:Semaphorin-5B n=2 Tax=Folsomia candida TaxID=158441 RepID=A0A226E837_FOLCA|nr:Semaphorin-5B [Folsomia candida]